MASFEEGQMIETSVRPTVTPHLHPIDWAARLSGRPIIDRALPGAVPTLVRRWQGIDPVIDQSALDQHYLTVHLGGAKRLHRSGEGSRLVCDVPAGAHSVVPAGAAFQWRTEGPVDFLHLYVAPAALDGFIAEAFERGDRSLALRDSLGEVDPLIAPLSIALSDALTQDDTASPAYLEDIVHLLLFRMLKRQADDQAAPARVLHALPPYRLKRALDFIEAHLAEPIGVTQIAAVAGTSAFHFSRAFRSAMGKPPYAFLLERRIERAKVLLALGGVSVPDIAVQCGFAGPSQLARAFRRATGASPTSWRNSH